MSKTVSKTTIRNITNIDHVKKIKVETAEWKELQWKKSQSTQLLGKDNKKHFISQPKNSIWQLKFRMALYVLVTNIKN